jgi:hypothetical protein
MELSNEIKRDLCQQYAINENHRQTIVISFLSILIASTTAYGISLSEFIKDANYKSSIIFLIAGCFTIILFLIPVIFSIINGYALRRDQLVVDNIRKNAFNKKEYNDIFNSYNPIKQDCSYLQDFNMAIVLISVLLQLLTFFVTFSIICITELSECLCISFIIKFFSFGLLFIIFSITILFQISFFRRYSKKYKKRKSEYLMLIL